VFAETLVLGAAPLSPLGHVEALREMGVTGVVNLCDEYDGPVELYKR
jgi:atypical dual specificity phosphatase